MFLPSLQTADVGEASERRVAGFGVFVESGWWGRGALEVLRDGLDGVSDLTSNGQLFWLRVAVHAVTFPTIGATNPWEVAIIVEITLLYIPEAFC